MKRIQLYMLILLAILIVDNSVFCQQTEKNLQEIVLFPHQLCKSQDNFISPPDNLKLIYSTDSFNTTNEVNAVFNGENYVCMIPSQKSGSVVQYIIKEELSYDVVTFGANGSTSPFFLLVDFMSVVSENFETNNGWQFGINSNEIQFRMKG